MTKRKLPYRISRVRISNIRGFKELDIDFTSDGSGGISNWNLLLGNNGVGKTTFLRCISIALGDREHASSLLRDSQGNWIPDDSISDAGSIQVNLVSPDHSNKPIKVKVGIQRDGERESISHFSPKDSSFIEDIFVCAYGLSRSLSANQEYSGYRAIDAVYSLFEYSTPLQSPELIIRRTKDWEGNQEELLVAIDKLLMLPEGSTKLTRTGLKIDGPWNSPTKLETLGDGYRAMVNWIADFVGWSIYYYNEVMPQNEIYGVILLDELEMGLHPIWQRKIIKLLHSQFPNVQFIVTSHSPVCTLGMTDIQNDEELKVIVFEHSENGITAGPIDISLAHQRLDRILTSQLFQLRSVTNDEIENKINELASLPSSDKERSADTEALEKSLIHDIRNSMSGSTLDQGDSVGRALQISLEEQLLATIKSSDSEFSHKQVGALEISRRLKKLEVEEE